MSRAVKMSRHCSQLGMKKTDAVGGVSEREDLGDVKKAFWMKKVVGSGSNKIKQPKPMPSHRSRKVLSLKANTSVSEPEEPNIPAISEKHACQGQSKLKVLLKHQEQLLREVELLSQGMMQTKQRERVEGTLNSILKKAGQALKCTPAFESIITNHIKATTAMFSKMKQSVQGYLQQNKVNQLIDKNINLNKQNHNLVNSLQDLQKQMQKKQQLPSHNFIQSNLKQINYQELFENKIYGEEYRMANGEACRYFCYNYLRPLLILDNSVSLPILHQKTLYQMLENSEANEVFSTLLYGEQNTDVISSFTRELCHETVNISFLNSLINLIKKIRIKSPQKNYSFSIVEWISLVNRTTVILNPQTKIEFLRELLGKMRKDDDHIFEEKTINSILNEFMEFQKEQEAEDKENYIQNQTPSDYQKQENTDRLLLHQKIKGIKTISLVNCANLFERKSHKTSISIEEHQSKQKRPSIKGRDAYFRKVRVQFLELLLSLYYYLSTQMAWVKKAVFYSLQCQNLTYQSLLESLKKYGNKELIESYVKSKNKIEAIINVQKTKNKLKDGSRKMDVQRLVGEVFKELEENISSKIDDNF